MWCGEYLDDKKSKFRKTLISKLLDEFNENIDEKELHSTELH